MAYTTTTLAAACGLLDTNVVLTSATSVAAGNMLIIDSERMRVGGGYTTGTTVPVLRGKEGTASAAHLNGAGVANGIAAADFGPVSPGEVVDYQLNRGNFGAVDITATGATGTTAAMLPTQVPCLVTATGVSGAGVQLPTGAATPGALYTVKNMTTGVLKVYAVGGTINGTTGTTAVSVSATGNLGFNIMCTVAGAWQITPIPT